MENVYPFFTRRGRVPKSPYDSNIIFSSRFVSYLLQRMKLLKQQLKKNNHNNNNNNNNKIIIKMMNNKTEEWAYLKAIGDRTWTVCFLPVTEHLFKMLKFKNSKIQKFKNSKIQKFNNSKIQLDFPSMNDPKSRPHSSRVNRKWEKMRENKKNKRIKEYCSWFIWHWKR